jgi:hypothetical protein
LPGCANKKEEDEGGLEGRSNDSWCYNHPDDPSCRPVMPDEISMLFNPFTGPYLSNNLVVDSDMSVSLYDLIWDLLVTYETLSIDYQELAQSGMPNELTSQQVKLFRNKGDDLPLEVHLLSATSHMPFVIFLFMLSEESETNYLAGNNWEMNFEPHFLSELMANNPNVLYKAMTFYQLHQDEIIDSQDFLKDILGDTFGDVIE